MQKNSKQLNPVHKASGSSKQNKTARFFRELGRLATEHPGLTVSIIVTAASLTFGSGNVQAQTKETKGKPVAGLVQDSKQLAMVSNKEKTDIDNRMKVTYENGIKIVGEKTFDVEIKDGVLNTSSGKIIYNEKGIEQMTRMLKEMTASEQPTTSEIKEIIYVKDPTGSRLAFVVFKSGITALAPDNRDTDQHIRGVISADRSEIFTHERAIFVAENGTIVATTPTILLIITPNDVIGISYTSRFGNSAPPLQKPTITGSSLPEIVVLRDPVLRDAEGAIKLEINLNTFSIDGVDDRLASLGALR